MDLQGHRVLNRANLDGESAASRFLFCHGSPLVFSLARKNHVERYHLIFACCSQKLPV
jgi:hypothetical protein